MPNSSGVDRAWVEDSLTGLTLDPGSTSVQVLRLVWQEASES